MINIDVAINIDVTIDITIDFDVAISDSNMIRNNTNCTYV